jgi:hypothetical protein
MGEPAYEWKGRWFQRIGWRVFPRTLESDVKELIKRGKDEYRHQRDWSLDQVTSYSNSEARHVVREFLTAARNASEDSPLLLGVRLRDRRRHGWKHVTYDDVKDRANKAISPRAPALRFEKWTKSKRKKIFLQALQGRRGNRVSDSLVPRRRRETKDCSSPHEKQSFRSKYPPYTIRRRSRRRVRHHHLSGFDVQRRRCCQGSRLWQARQALSALTSG